MSSKLPLVLVSALAVAGLFGASTASATSGMSAPAPVASGSAAGGKTYPMQAWMKANMAPAMQSGDFGKIKEKLKFIADHPVKGMSDWAKISNEGIAKAEKKDLDGVKASCKACHDKYQKEYKDKHREEAWGK